MAEARGVIVLNEKLRLGFVLRAVRLRERAQLTSIGHNIPQQERESLLRWRSNVRFAGYSFTHLLPLRSACPESHKLCLSSLVTGGGSVENIDIPMPKNKKACLN